MRRRWRKFLCRHRGCKIYVVAEYEEYHEQLVACARCEKSWYRWTTDHPIPKGFTSP